MIGIALKHFIYDICIDQVFNGIEKNFVQCNRRLSIVRVGDKFRKIVVMNKYEYHCYDCTVHVIAGTSGNKDFAIHAGLVQVDGRYVERNSMIIAYDEILEYEKL
jgi:hypothetical protein